jgi:hypothetical protein
MQRIQEVTQMTISTVPFTIRRNSNRWMNRVRCFDGCSAVVLGMECR